MSLRLKLIFFISFLFITAIANAIFTFTLENYSEEKLRWVNHTNEVMILTEKYLGDLRDTETGQRGFLLTKDNSYLEPYYSGLTNAKENFKKLKYLTSDNIEQQKRLKSIEKSMNFKFAELKETIKLAEVNIADALAIVKQDKGKKYMDDIRSKLKEFVNIEMLLLEKRKGDFREHRAKITTLIIVEIMFFIFLALMTISFLNRNLFAPLKLLLTSTHKMEDGEKVDITDILQKDEMGYLLTSFYKMHEKVHARTEELSYVANHDDLTGLKKQNNYV